MGGHNPVADTFDLPATKSEMDEMEKSIRFVVQHMPGHEDYLKRYCPAPTI